MGLEIKSGTSSTLAVVNTDQELQVSLAKLATKSGFSSLVCESDPGAVTGARLMIALEGTEDYRLRVGTDTIVFQESFAGAALNTAQWQSTLTTFTQTVLTGYTRLNAGAVVTASAVARCQSYRTFNLAQSFPTFFETTMQIVAASPGILNTTVECGLGLATGITLPTDGALLRIDATGVAKLIYNFNGTEFSSASIPLTNFPVNTDIKVVLEVSARTLKLWLNDVLVSRLDKGASVPTLAWASSLPILMRVYNSASAPATATTVLFGPVTVSLGDQQSGLPTADRLALAGYSGYQGQSGGTMGNTANYANSAAPATGTPTNTAAGYTTLGGQWRIAAVIGAETDLCLFGFQVPVQAAGSNNLNLLVRGVRISTVNEVAAVGAGPTIFQWALAVGSTAVSLATAESATTKAPRRITLGEQSLLALAGIGQMAGPPIDVKFSSPLLAEAGTFVQVILKMPQGVATATETFRGTVYIDSQWVA